MQGSPFGPSSTSLALATTQISPPSLRMRWLMKSLTQPCSMRRSMNISRFLEST